MLLTLAILLLSAILFTYAAFVDFMTWKIPNRVVLALCGAFVVYAAAAFALGVAPALGLDMVVAVGGGLLLFAIGFALWMLKLFGAGDAKLMAPIGLFLGWYSLMPFAIWLAVFAAVALLALKLPLPAGLGSTMPGMRLDEIRRTGKVPYAVILVAALFATLGPKYAAIFGY
jgi:prepilin peptidase CpaA